MKIHMITFLLLIVGGLNWLLLGVFGWEIGELFGGSGAVVSRIIYVLVGLSAIYEIATHKSSCKCCDGKCDSGSATAASASDMGNSNPTV